MKLRTTSHPAAGVLDPDVIGMMLDVVGPWVIQQGFQPTDLTRHVELLPDGDVMLRRYVTDKLGRKQLDPSGEAPLTEDIRVHPLTPFPFDSPASAIALYHRNRSTELAASSG